jgi:hypothetical protein
MFKQINNSVVSNKLGSFAAAVAAVTAVAVAPGNAAISTITGITTQLVTGSSTMVPNLPGVGASYSQFQAPNTFNVTYQGNDLQLKTVTANGVTYAASGMASAVVERGSNGTDTDNIWYAGSNSGSNINLQGPKEGSLISAFGANNLLVGADNIFSNTGNAVGDNTNIVRLDMIFPAGFNASSSTAFAVFDRGTSTDHDAFQMAAITGLSNTGVPTNYGPLLSFGEGGWGTTDLITTQEEVILRKNDSAGSTAPFDPSDSTLQNIGGVLVPTGGNGALVPAGTKIYGYSLFSAVANGTGTELADYTNTTYFPAADSTAAQGGLDPVGTTAVLFSVAVPEPTTISIAGVAALGLLGRRRRKVVAAA